MNVFFRAQRAKVGALATAALVALGIVTAPLGPPASAITHTEVAAIQLQAAVSTHIATLVNASAASAPSAAEMIAPVGPQASATGGTDALTQIATAAIAIAAAPLWYLAFPVTLPLSVIGGIAFLNFLNGLPLGFGGGGQGDPITLSLIGALLGLGAFIVGPPALAIGAVSSLFNASAMPAASILSSESAAVGPTTTPDSNTVGAQPDALRPSVTYNGSSVPDSSPTTTTALTAANAAATGGNDPLTSLGRGLLNLVGPVLAPIWWVALPITFQLYLNARQKAIATSAIDYLGWFGAPFSLGNLFFPESTPAPTASAEGSADSVAATQGVNASGAVAVDGLAVDPATLGTAPELVGSPNRRERESAQRAVAFEQPAASATPLAVATPGTTAPSAMITTSDTTDIPATSDLASDSAATGITDNAADALSRAGSPTKSNTHAPSIQRVGKTPTATTGGRANAN